MSDVAALLYLECCIALNKLRRLFRQPARLMLWALFFLWFGFFFFARVAWLSQGHYQIFMPATTRLLYTFVPAIYIAILGMQIRAGTRRPPAAFAYPADGRFLLGSRLSHVLVVFWLQLREAAFQGSRLFLGLFFFSWYFAPSTLGLIFATLAMLCAYVIGFGIRLPVFLLQRRFPRAPLAWCGAALIATGLLTLAYPVALAFSSGNVRLSFIAAHTIVYPPGVWIVQALGGNAGSLTIMLVLAALMVSLGSVAAVDVYPEIWEASARLYARRAIIASGRALWNREALRELYDVDPGKPPATAQRVASVSGSGAPVGAWIIFWKEWIALRRSPGGLRWPIFWILSAFFFGYLVGLAAAEFEPILLLGPVVAIANIVVVIGSQSTITLGGELRKPIWWLSNSLLSNRVFAWVLGTTLRVAPPLAAGALAAGLAAHSWIIVVAAVPVTAVGLFLVQSIGVASYVMLPGRNDLRGPGFMLRVFTTYLLLVPPAIAWGFAMMTSQSALAGIAAGTGSAFVEGWLLVIFAAARLEQNAMAYAAAEQH